MASTVDQMQGKLFQAAGDSDNSLATGVDQQN
jgi:hypothetical protein